MSGVTYRLGLLGSFSFLDARFFFSGAAAFTFFSSLVVVLGMLAVPRRRRGVCQSGNAVSGDDEGVRDSKTGDQCGDRCEVKDLYLIEERCVDIQG